MTQQTKLVNTAQPAQILTGAHVWLEAGVSSPPFGFRWAGFGTNPRGMKDTRHYEVRFATTNGNPPSGRYHFFQDMGGNVAAFVTGVDV